MERLQAQTIPSSVLVLKLEQCITAIIFINTVQVRRPDIMEEKIIEAREKIRISEGRLGKSTS